MASALTDKLTRLVKEMRGQARITESNVQDMLREVRMALLEADVALPVVKAFVNQVRERAMGQEVMGSLTPGQAVVGVVHEELVKLMGEQNDSLNLAAVPPAIVLMAGLQGAGKTTTTGKLAKLLKEKSKKKAAEAESAQSTDNTADQTASNTGADGQNTNSQEGENTQDAAAPADTAG